MKTVAIVGALDTKGHENQYLAEQLEKEGVIPFVIDVGIMGEPLFVADITAEETAQAGGSSLRALRTGDSKAASIDVMGRGAAKIAAELAECGKIHGIISMGGSQGTTMATAVMRAMPIGFPKVLISTLATVEGQQKPFEGIRDTMVMNPLVDVAGQNEILRMIMDKASATVAAMTHVKALCENGNEKRIALSMFGITTPCVNAIGEILSKHGYEVLVFHTTGRGGRIMEDLIREGYIQGVVDVTLGEISHELIGGVGSAGPHRLEAAGEKGIPQVVCLGALDVINFMPPESTPEKFNGRKFLMHNSNLKVMRTSPEENAEIGKCIAEKLNRAQGNVVVLIPLRGVSANDMQGQDFYDPQADHVLFEAVKTGLDPKIKCIELDFHINDIQFAQEAAKIALALFENQKQDGHI